MISDSEFSIDSQTRVAAQALDAVLASTGPGDLCRQIVHSEFVPNNTRGCQLFYLDNKSTLRVIASYGIVASGNEEFSAWDDSPLSEAIREKGIRSDVVSIEDKKYQGLAVPFISNGVPTGLLALVIDNVNLVVKFSEGMAEVFAKLGAFYLETLDFGNMTNGNGGVSGPITPEDLTTRQLTILSHIDQGLVNLEIAKILMLSESTIRQETVKIYRALGVGNRQEAVKKAKALGVLPKRTALGGGSLSLANASTKTPGITPGGFCLKLGNTYFFSFTAWLGKAAFHFLARVLKRFLVTRLASFACRSATCFARFAEPFPFTTN